MRTIMTSIALVVASPCLAQTQTQTQRCTTTAPLPPELAGWSDPVVAKDGGTLAISRAADVKLAADARFTVPPEKTPSAGTLGANVAFTVAAAGTYRIALGSGVWIDVVRDGKPVASKAHGHGPACSSVRKMVDFALMPGRYVVQVSGAKTPAVRIIVARMP